MEERGIFSDKFCAHCHAKNTFQVRLEARKHREVGDGECLACGRDDGLATEEEFKEMLFKDALFYGPMRGLGPMNESEFQARKRKVPERYWEDFDREFKAWRKI